jgi:glycosyltransferase involved in cell wall biosynthesis
VHVCYCHNPFRYAWNDRDRTLAAADPVSRVLLRQLFRRWRQWDWIAAQRVDRYLANSHATQRRIAAYFGRESHVVYPPVDTARFAPAPVGDDYLVLSELMPHKRIETAVLAFNRLRLPLVVAGDGPDSRRLRRLAGPTIRFAGRVTDKEAARLLASCRALVVTAVEEFGIAAVEAQAAGRPVLALHAGGASETVIEGITGHFWDGGPDELAEAVLALDAEAIDPQACIENSARFRLEEFQAELPRHVAAAVDDARGGARVERRAARAGGRPGGLRLRRRLG